MCKLILLLLSLLVCPVIVIANDSDGPRVYRDKYGNTTGYRDRQGDSYFYRDSYGNTTATETRQGRDTIVRDRYGNTVGSYSK
jgi:YD repeat-containing protein